jgi:hypothetical protein
MTWIGQAVKCGLGPSQVCRFRVWTMCLAPNPGPRGLGLFVVKLGPTRP